MSDMDHYMPPVDLNAPMRGAVCGTVLKSNHPDYAEGTVVSGLGTWADYQIGTPETMNPMGELESIATVDGFSTFAIVGPTTYIGRFLAQMYARFSPQPVVHAGGRGCGCARGRYAAGKSSVAQSTAVCAAPLLVGGLLGGSQLDRKVLRRWHLQGDEP